MTILQKIITLDSTNGDYYNFFNSPGSLGSLQSYLDKGWVVIKMDLDTNNQRGWVFLEKTIKEY